MANARPAKMIVRNATPAPLSAEIRATPSIAPSLPPSTILEVPYEDLVADQEGWTRKILQFAGLEWNDRCLQFEDTRRPVVTASNWQVRQKIYRTSVQRWRHYEPYIGPLLDLQDIDERLGVDQLPPAQQPILSYRITYSIPSFLTRYLSARKLMPRSFAAAVLL